ncbi:Capn15 [Symbiodinium natans]|uniref:Capn15 protein n=1 Tax=Symbiodinium natans TaxID=878477 RepID=A0A812PWQ9_9DINO|nr:Capn15 [Symbiodinium natans]
MSLRSMTLPFRLHRRQFFTANREVLEAVKKLESKVDSLEKRFDGLEKKVDSLESKWDTFLAEYRKEWREATIAWSSIKAWGGGFMAFVAALAGIVKFQEALDKAVLDRTSCCCS